MKREVPSEASHARPSVAFLVRALYSICDRLVLLISMSTPPIETPIQGRGMNKDWGDGVAHGIELGKAHGLTSGYKEGFDQGYARGIRAAHADVCATCLGPTPRFGSRYRMGARDPKWEPSVPCSPTLLEGDDDERDELPHERMDKKKPLELTKHSGMQPAHKPEDKNNVDPAQTPKRRRHGWSGI